MPAAPLSLLPPVALPAFEGPLDLLLHLIREHRVDIADIPIVQITDQYLAYLRAMEAMNLDIAGEFLLVAATLLEIKSPTKARGMARTHAPCWSSGCKTTRALRPSSGPCPNGRKTARRCFSGARPTTAASTRCRPSSARSGPTPCSGRCTGCWPRPATTAARR